MLLKLCFTLFLATIYAETGEVLGGEKPRTISRAGSQGYSLAAYSSSAKDSGIWFSFFQMYGFPSVRVNSTVTGKEGTRKADFRITPIRIIEFNASIPIDQSASKFEFQNKQPNWSQITVEKMNVKIDKKDTTIVRMNATLTEGTFKYTMNVYLTDRSCFYGNYNLDPDAAYIVQNIQGFPYKYAQSSIAVEQIIASRDSGQISSYLAFLESPFLGSLIISPEAYDTKLGKLPVVVSDFNEVEFKIVTSDMARESNYEQVFVGIGSDKQPSDVFFEEKFAVNLGLVKEEGFEPTGTESGSNPTGIESDSAASQVCPSYFFAALLAGFVALF